MTLADPGPTGAVSRDDQCVILGFCGERNTVARDERFIFGRAGDLVVDENPFLHRRLGMLEHRDGWWWLHNLGSRIALVVKDRTSRSQATIAPGRALVLTSAEVVVQFSAGRANYELEISIPANTNRAASPPEGAGGDPVEASDDCAGTVSLADLPLTDDQHRLILALAEPTLRTTDAEVCLPTNREAALRLGWTITKFNRKLDNVCERLTKAGVSGLRGGLGGMATDRRTRLVDHAVASGIVTVDQLPLLDRTAP